MKRVISKAICLLLVAGMLLSLAAVVPGRAAAEAAGDCGEKITWTFDEATGTLTLVGVGDMPDFENEEDMPWAEFAKDIKKIVIKSGIRTIGKNAFSGCAALEEVVVPVTLTAVNEGAFKGCESLTEIDLSATRVRTVGAEAFADCAALEEVNLPATIVSVDTTAFVGAESLAKVTVIGDEEKAAAVMQDVEIPEDADVIPVEEEEEEVTYPVYPVNPGSAETTKVYTENGFEVTETWRGDKLVKIVRKSLEEGEDFVMVETGFDGEYPTHVEYYQDGEHYADSELEWGEDGEFIKEAFSVFTHDGTLESYNVHEPEGSYTYYYAVDAASGELREHYYGSGMYDVNNGFQGQRPANAPDCVSNYEETEETPYGTVTFVYEDGVMTKQISVYSGEEEGMGGTSVYYCTGEKAGWNERYDQDGKFQYSSKCENHEDGTVVITTIGAEGGKNIMCGTEEEDVSGGFMYIKPFLELSYNPDGELTYHHVVEEDGNWYEYRYAKDATTGEWSEQYIGHGKFDVDNGGTQGQRNEDAPVTGFVPSPSVEVFEAA